MAVLPDMIWNFKLMTKSAENFNISGRSLKDSIVALHIDQPVDEGFELRTLSTPGFTGTNGDGIFSLNGFSAIEDAESGAVTFYIVNNRPSVDLTSGNLLYQSVSGANSTVDVFVLKRDATELEFVRSYVNKHISTPNRVAALKDGSFYLSNDHGHHKLGLVS